MVPLCDAGRWGAKDLATAKIKKIGVPTIHAAFVDVLGAKIKKRTKAKPSDGVDEIAIDQMQVFAETRSK